jgi:hypothetical protein
LGEVFENQIGLRVIEVFYGDEVVLGAFLRKREGNQKSGAKGPERSELARASFLKR